VVEDSSGNAGAPSQPIVREEELSARFMSPNLLQKGNWPRSRLMGPFSTGSRGPGRGPAEITLEAASKTYYASHCWNPFFLHGTKTFAYEVWEQMNRKEPDTLVLPVGHGTLFLGVYLGFQN